MPPQPPLMTPIHIPIRQLIQPRLIPHLGPDGIERQEDQPGEDPDGGEDEEHHAEEADEDVGVW